MAKSDRQRRTPKRITFDTREEALASLKKVLESGRKIEPVASTTAKADKPLEGDK